MTFDDFKAQLNEGLITDAEIEEVLSNLQSWLQKTAEDLWQNWEEKGMNVKFGERTIAHFSIALSQIQEELNTTISLYFDRAYEDIEKKHR